MEIDENCEAMHGNVKFKIDLIVWKYYRRV